MDTTPAPWLARFIANEHLPAAFAEEVARVHRPLTEGIASAARAHGPGFVLGLCGPQGSGKSTVVKVMQRLLEADGLTVAVLSLDDLYLTRAERHRLAAEVHPLLATRGPPGTHDVTLGLTVLDALAHSGPVAIPRFDKGKDDRKPKSQWEVATGPVDVILFEGWCVGAISQPQAALIDPVNALERDQDPDGRWRRYVNAALAGDYQILFARIDLFLLLQPPSFAVVEGWRMEQETKLREASPGGEGVMSEAQVRRFVAHYERITRWLMAEAPARADVVIRLDADRRAEAPIWRSAEPSDG